MMKLRHLHEDTTALTLYHGTLKSAVPNILEQGLNPSSGWGGAGTEGVYLAGSIDSAKYWALFAYAREQEIDFELTDRLLKLEARTMRNIAILEVRIPQDQLANLQADMEQAEDVQYEGDPEDWRASLEQIGDVMYRGTIPPSWISEVRM